MALQQVVFGEIKERIRVGDVIAFSGKKRFSRLIRLATRSIISHVGIVCQAGQSVEVIESVSLKPNGEGGGETGGVQCRALGRRAESYDGMMWWLPLNADARTRFDPEKFTEFLQSAKVKKYDMPQAIRAVLDLIDDNPFFDLTTYNQKDFNEFFCSELAAAALQAAGVIQNINPSEVTPSDLCTFDIFAAEYFQMRGRRKEIDGYNSVAAEHFGISSRP